ncbi:hypothetical protein HK405_003828, partial [Cladochytrium tenue]
MSAPSLPLTKINHTAHVGDSIAKLREIAAFLDLDGGSDIIWHRLDLTGPGGNSTLPVSASE